MLFSGLTKCLKSMKLIYSVEFLWQQFFFRFYWIKFCWLSCFLLYEFQFLHCPVYAYFIGSILAAGILLFYMFTMSECNF